MPVEKGHKKRGCQEHLEKWNTKDFSSSCNTIHSSRWNDLSPLEIAAGQMFRYPAVGLEEEEEEEEVEGEVEEGACASLPLCHWMLLAMMR